MITAIDFEAIDVRDILITVKMDLNHKQRELADHVVSELRRHFPEVQSVVYEQVPTYPQYLWIEITAPSPDEDREYEIRSRGAEMVSDILVDYGYMMLVSVRNPFLSDNDDKKESHSTTLNGTH
jgi:hypothetical protein